MTGKKVASALLVMSIGGVFAKTTYDFASLVDTNNAIINSDIKELA